jgi:hypothetical protein
LLTTRTLAHQLERRAAITPEVLQNKVTLRISGIIEFQELQDFMRPLVSMYEQHIDAIHHTIPEAQLPMDVWQCDAGVKEFCPETGQLLQLVTSSGFIKITKGDNGKLCAVEEIDETPAPGVRRHAI